MSLKRVYWSKPRLNIAQDVEELEQLCGGLLGLAFRAKDQGDAHASAVEAGGLALHRKLERPTLGTVETVQLWGDVNFDLDVVRASHVGDQRVGTIVELGILVACDKLSKTHALLPGRREALDQGFVHFARDFMAVVGSDIAHVWMAVQWIILCSKQTQGITLILAMSGKISAMTR
jgi:hypothetical protein